MTCCGRQITQAELHRQFHSLGAGVIEDVRVQKEKGFGFVRYRTHAEAAFAIQAANGRVIWGKSLKVRGFRLTVYKQLRMGLMQWAFRFATSVE